MEGKHPHQSAAPAWSTARVTVFVSAGALVCAAMAANWVLEERLTQLWKLALLCCIAAGVMGICYALKAHYGRDTLRGSILSAIGAVLFIVFISMIHPHREIGIPHMLGFAAGLGAGALGMMRWKHYIVDNKWIVKSPRAGNLRSRDAWKTALEIWIGPVVFATVAALVVLKLFPFAAAFKSFAGMMLGSVFYGYAWIYAYEKRNSTQIIIERSPIEEPPPRTARGLLVRFRTFLLIPVLLAGIGLCYAYGRLIEVNWIRIKRVEIPIRRLPAEFDGFKIVHLSDLHVAEMGRREEMLPILVNSLGADAIFITGDFADFDRGIIHAASIISRLQAKYGKWGVLGNWDSRETEKACEEAGLKILMAETETIERNGRQLGIIGLRFEDTLPFYSTEEKSDIIAGLKSEFSTGTPVILLAHLPRTIRAAQEEDIDLVLAGHTHGGQVRIPFGPAIITLSDMGIWISKGLYKFKDTHLYINPGIGLEPGPAYIQVRFWCRPEITVVILRPAN